MIGQFGCGYRPALDITGMEPGFGVYRATQRCIGGLVGSVFVWIAHNE